MQLLMVLSGTAGSAVDHNWSSRCFHHIRKPNGQKTMSAKLGIQHTATSSPGGKYEHHFPPIVRYWLGGKVTLDDILSLDELIVSK